MNKDELTKRLDCYLERDNPDYAIMITGKWGTGKTYFIKDYIKNSYKRAIRNRFFYLSLYGAKDESYIEKRIWPQILKQSIPEIKNKLQEKTIILLCISAILVCIIVAIIRDEGVYGFISLLLRIIGTATLITIGIWLYDIVKIYLLDKFIKEKTVIVFDDFERAKLPFDILLAYLNRYVEHLHKHIIIICNEDEVQNSEVLIKQTRKDNPVEQSLSSDNNQKSNKVEPCSSYLKLKEKVIGETYILENEPKPIQQNIFNKEKLPILKHIVNQGIASDFYFYYATKPAESINYRVWIQCCREFEYIFRDIPLKYFDNEVIIYRLLPCFFSLTYALRIHDFGENHIFTKDKAKELFCTSDRAQDIEWFFHLFSWKLHLKDILPNEIWETIIEKKEFDKEEITRHWDLLLRKTHPLWLQVYNYFEQTDEEIDKTWKKLKKEYYRRSIHDPSQIASIFFSVENMIITHCIPSKKLTHKHVLELALRYINSTSLEYDGDVRPNIDRILSVCETYGHHQAPQDIRNEFKKAFTHVLQQHDVETTIPNRFAEFLRILDYEENLFGVYWVGEGLRTKIIFEGQSSKKLLDRLLELSPKRMRERLDSVEDHLFNVFSLKDSYLDFEISFSNDLKSLIDEAENNKIRIDSSKVYILRVTKDEIDSDIEKKQAILNNNKNYIYLKNKEPEQ